MPDLMDAATMATVLGMGIMLVAVTILNTGIVMQKKAVDRMPLFETMGTLAVLGRLARSPLWLVGWILNVVAVILNMVALGQADMTVIQPLHGVGLIVLVVLSRRYLQESISVREWVGVGLAVLSVAVLGVAGEQSQSVTTPEAAVAQYLQPRALAMSIGIVTLGIVLWMSCRWPRFRSGGVVLAFLSGTFSVVGLTFSKGLIVVVNLEGLGPALTRLDTWVLAALFFAAAVLAIGLQQAALQRGKAVLVTPIISLTLVAVPVPVGAVIFGEEMTVPRLAAMSLAAVAVLILGSTPAAAGGEPPQSA